MNSELDKPMCEFCSVVYRLCDLGVIIYLRLQLNNYNIGVIMYFMTWWL